MPIHVLLCKVMTLAFVPAHRASRQLLAAATVTQIGAVGLWHLDRLQICRVGP